MKHSIKSFLTTPFVCLILIISLLALPMNASAETGTLGKETPVITCNYYDANGKVVNGNRLPAGTYTVDVVLSGMKAVSVIQLTANFTSTVTAMSVKSTYADNHDMELGGQKLESGNLTVFQISENADTSVIDKNGTVMLTLSATVSSFCDFADVFSFSDDPNLTFIEADYGDGYNDCYALNANASYSAGKLYPMTADVTPYIAPTAFYVNGKITPAGDKTGATITNGVAGITVSVKGTEIKAVTDENGSYTLPEINAGNYTLVISGDTTIDREVALTVAADKAVDYDQINVDAVGVVICDYNKDGKVNTTDATLYTTATAFTDLNADGAVDNKDSALFKTFFNKTVRYTAITLK